MTILSWIEETCGRMELADIARPRVGEETNLTADYVMRKWDEVDRWLEKETEKVMEKVVGIDSGLEEMLRKVLKMIWTGYLVRERQMRG